MCLLTLQAIEEQLLSARDMKPVQKQVSHD